MVLYNVQHTGMIRNMIHLISPLSLCLFFSLLIFHNCSCFLFRSPLIFKKLLIAHRSRHNVWQMSRRRFSEQESVSSKRRKKEEASWDGRRTKMKDKEEAKEKSKPHSIGCYWGQFLLRSFANIYSRKSNLILKIQTWHSLMIHESKSQYTPKKLILSPFMK